MGNCSHVRVTSFVLFNMAEEEGGVRAMSDLSKTIEALRATRDLDTCLQGKNAATTSIEWSAIQPNIALIGP